MSFIVIGASLLVFSTSLYAQADLTEFQKQTIESVRSITLQLILIAVGVFALLGSFSTAENAKFRTRWLLWLAFICLGFSVVAGLLAYGNLIWSLSRREFDPGGTLAELAKWQWILFGSGGLLFAIFVLLNIKGR
jgi:hypothetical protein